MRTLTTHQRMPAEPAVQPAAPEPRAREHRLLALQRTLGNAHVVRALRDGGRMVRRISYLERVPATPELLGRVDVAIADIERTLAGASGPEVDELREGVAALRALRERDAITFWVISGGLVYATYDNASGELRLHVNPEFGRRAFVPSRLVHEAIHAVHAGRYPRLARAYGEVLAAGGTEDERLGVVLLQWKAWTEYWAYRRAVEYENLRSG